MPSRSYVPSPFTIRLSSSFTMVPPVLKAYGEARDCGSMLHEFFHQKKVP